MTMKEFRQEQQTTNIKPAKTLGIRTNKNQGHNIRLRHQLINVYAAINLGEKNSGKNLPEIRNSN